MQGFIPSIGMEVHAELSTRTKMFCRCPVEFGGEPNTRTCPICLGMPGTLPVPNKNAIQMVLRTALALNCQIAMQSIFHRKNYFYPDLPKGYQVSQYGETNPLGYGGWLDIPRAGGESKRIRIRRVHLEEDTGKLLHLPSGGSGIDFNRAGTPLMEIVTDFPPDIADADEAREYLVQLRQILMYLGVCDGKMEEGSLRCEPNISVRQGEESPLGTKTELKNLNSFRSVQLGIGYEIKRQAGEIGEGQTIRQETRGWNEAKEQSYLMRVKEEENDYRYFPDPDLVPMAFDDAQIEKLRDSIPELPLAKRNRYRGLGLSNEKEIDALISDLDKAAYFDDYLSAGGDPKEGCNWILNNLAKEANQLNTEIGKVSVGPNQLIELVQLYQSGRITRQQAKEVLALAISSGSSPSAVVESDPRFAAGETISLKDLVQQTLAEHRNIVEKYQSGQQSVKGFLVGQIMRQSKGAADPKAVQDSLQEALDALEAKS